MPRLWNAEPAGRTLRCQPSRHGVRDDGPVRRLIPALLAASVLLVACGGDGTAPTRVGDLAGSKIGFIFVGRHDDLGYNQAIWEGSEAVARAFPDHRVLRQENVPESPAAEAAMERMIEHGARIIFATSYGHLRYAVNVARRHPEVIVLHEGGREPHPRLANFGTYWGAVYEPVYEAGIAAGAVTKTGRLGFIAAFPIPATFNNINAFTLGARSVNPTVTTNIVFTGSWCDPPEQEQAAAELLRQGVDVLTQHQDCTKTALLAAEAKGVYSVGYHADGSEVAPKGWLVGSVWHWDDLVTDIVRTVLDGRFATSKYNGDYLGGLRTGDNPFVLSEFGPAVDANTHEQVAAAGQRFLNGDSPFQGPVVDRDGRQRVARGVIPSYDEIERTDYVVAGVVGTIPQS